MKRSFLISLIILCTICAQAQFTKGTIQVGGGIFFNKSSSDNDVPVNTYQSAHSSSHFAVSPRVGIFLSKSGSLGLKFGYTERKDESIYNTGSYINRHSSKSSIAGISIYYRQLFPLFNKVYFFLEPLVGISSGPEERTDTNALVTKNDYRSIGVSLSPGVSVLVNDKFSLDASIGGISYSKEKTKGENSSKNSFESFYASVSLSTISLGINYFFLK